MMDEMQHDDLQVVILAAGKGKRMQSRLPKVLHPLLGRPMLDHILHAVRALRPQRIVVITGHESEQVRSYFRHDDSIVWVEQHEQLGTGHALLQCRSVLAEHGRVLVLCGDTPLLRSSTLEHLICVHRQHHHGVSLLSAQLDQPDGYGRIVRAGNGQLLGIIEHKDANAAQRAIGEVNSGIYCIDGVRLFSLLDRLDNNNAQGEYYLPDIVPLAIVDGIKVDALCMQDADEMHGVNDRRQLADVEQILQRRIIDAHMASGVTIEMAHTVRIESGVEIGRDTVIAAGTQLLGHTRIGTGCRVGPYAVVNDSRIADDATIYPYSHLDGAEVANMVRIGPYGRLRPGAKLAAEVHVGNFVEVKNAEVGAGSKINHLTYVGDSSVGTDCNIGAGTITCNYDGANKHRTIVGDRVFVGSNTLLVAPVEVADDATIGAGSIITKRVAPGGLTLTVRNDQRHVAHWQRPKKKEK